MTTETTDETSREVDRTRRVQKARERYGRLASLLEARLKVTTSSSSQSAIGGVATQVVRPKNETEDWRQVDVDRSKLENMSVAELMTFVLRTSPEGSRARWDILRNANDGFSYKVLDPLTGLVHEEGKALTEAFLSHLKSRHGSVTVVWNRMFMNAAHHGQILTELVLDRGGRVPLDIAVPDAGTVRFRPKRDPDYGDVFELGQKGSGPGNEFVSLDGVPTVRFLAIDDPPNEPYGTSPFEAMLFPALILLGVFRDLRRVIHQQGFPQRIVVIDTEKLLATMPRDEDLLDDDLPDQTDLDSYIAAALERGAGQFDAIDPDATIVVTDLYDVKLSQAAVGGGALAHLGAVIEALERSATRGAKSHPLLMGLTEGASEANANRQWEVYAKGVKVFQHPVENLIGENLEIALEAQGVAAVVEVRFAELRASEEYRDQQSMQLALQNAENMERLGYETHEGASLYAVKHPPLGTVAATTVEGEPAPTQVAEGEEAEVAAAEMPASGETDESTGRVTAVVRILADALYDRHRSQFADLITESLANGVRFTPVGAEDGFGPVPEETPTGRVDERDAAADFDHDLPEHAGLLDATVAEEAE